MKIAEGELLCFLDDDSLISANFFERLIKHFADPAVDAVGGPSLTPETDTAFQQAVAYLLASLLGAGGVRNRYRAVGAVRETSERELILCNLTVRRSAFEACGGFDERLYPNEENEFIDRLKLGGGKILHDPALAVLRSQRQNLFAFAKQMFRYGKGRARQTKISGVKGLTPFVPMFFVLYLFYLALFGTVYTVLPLAVYVLLVMITSLAALPARGMRVATLSALLLPVLHVSNGLGLITGFMLPLGDDKCYNEADVNVRRIKSA